MCKLHSATLEEETALSDKLSPFALIRAARTQRYTRGSILYYTAYAWFFVRAEGLPALHRDDQRVQLQRVNVPRSSEDARVNST